MSTRGAYGFRIDGTDKVTYNHCDSYPEHLGVNILQFLREVEDDELRKMASRIILVQDDSKPTPEEIEVCLASSMVDLHVGNQSVEDWYCLLRNAQGDLSIYGIKEGCEFFPFMIDSHEFLLDSLFCEWAYIVNLDSGMLEVYRGFNKDREAPGRYAAAYLSTGDEAYQGIALIWEIPLEYVRDITDADFLREIGHLCGNDED